MEKNYILFDLDGTITDSGDGIKNSIKYSLQRVGINEKDEEVLNSFIGPPLVDSYIKYYNFTLEEAKDVVEIYREYYKDRGLYENSLYDGIVDVLKILKDNGNDIILSTSKPELFARKVLEYYELTEYFKFIAGATMDHTRSHKNDVIEYILNSYKVDKKNTYMIGDRKYDILGGKKFGLNTIGVTYGYGDYEELKTAGADIIVNKPIEILDYFESI